MNKNNYNFKVSAVNLNEVIRQAIENIKKEATSEFELLMDYYEKNNSRAIENNVKDGWGLMNSLTPAEYLIPMELSSDERNKHFQSLFEQDDFKLLEVEFNHIIKYMGSGWEATLYECFILIKENKYRTTIPFLISILEKIMNRTIDREKNLWGSDLRETYESELKKLPKDDFGTINALTILDIFNDYIFKNKVNHHSEVPLFNRNLIQHGNDEPDRWHVTDALKIITLISGLIMVDNDLKKL